ncbi:MAG TPA: hypothetical protein DCZ05_10395 [Deltaproteobacteria bacterium]|nr:MAG: hypothetical protein A2X89_04820 [Deltaproteobacteria bacterium GWD2_55_8]HBA40124.1 hypothetical protein [Deltaproteobacteria bacterium]
MDAELLKIVGQVAGIGGIALGVLLLVFRDVIRKKIFPMLTKEQAYKLLRFVLLLAWLVALAGIGAWVWVSTYSVQNNVTVRTANDLRQEFARATALRTPPLNEDDFRRVLELITTLTQIDPRNGHAFYYSGQMKRWLGRKTEAQQDFYKYLENERQQPKVMREGDISAEACYRSTAGYCRQRSGWICHLLANDFYQKGLAEGSSDQARFHFDLAVQYAQKARVFFPGGFEQFTPTQMVERDSRARILTLDNAAKTRTK